MLYEWFHVLLFPTAEALTPKPNVYPDENEGEDCKRQSSVLMCDHLFLLVASFIDIIHRANLEPEKKYRQPQTTSQEIGWFHEPLVRIVFLFQRPTAHRRSSS